MERKDFLKTLGYGATAFGLSGGQAAMSAREILPMPDMHRNHTDQE